MRSRTEQERPSALRWYQQEAHDAVYQYFVDKMRAGDEPGNPLVEAPTGSGKTHIITELCRSVTHNRPGVRILVVTHQAELVKQNYDKFVNAYPNADAGMNCAGLKRRDFDHQIIFASVQSVAHKAHEIGRINLMIIDEAHMVPREGDGRYRTLIARLREQNPALRVVGLTASPYRLKTGPLIGKDTLFTDLAYRVDIKKLIEQGYLSPVFPIRTDTTIDVAGIKKSGGDFVARDLEIAADAHTAQIVDEIVQRGSDRRSWILFCCGVKHAHSVANLLLDEYCIPAAIITGDTPAAERAEIIEQFKQGKIRALVNVNVLTTGFDAPNVDLIALIRPTLSPGLFVQMVGRGMRVCEGKEDCLVLDFAGNTDRHGPIDMIKGPKEKRDCDEGVAPTKTCPKCQTIVFAGMRHCPNCGFEFPAPEPALETVASKSELISGSVKDPETLQISMIRIHRHKKNGKPDSLCVEFCDGPFFASHTEWLCLEHGGFAQTKARHLSKLIFGKSFDRVDQALEELPESMAVNMRITVVQNGKYTKLIKIHKDSA